MMDASLPSLYTNLRRILRSLSFRPFFLITGCCRIESELAQSSVYDMSRLGIKPAENPAEADVLVVGGWVNPRMEKKILEAYESLQLPKFVVAIGACAISGTPYGKENAKVIDSLIPVDVFVAGCPPRAEAFLEAFLKLKSKVAPSRDQSTVLESAIKVNTIQV